MGTKIACCEVDIDIIRPKPSVQPNIETMSYLKVSSVEENR